MARDEDVLQERLIRSVRPVGSGSRMQQTGATRVNVQPAASSTRVDSDGKVRRKWGPGDPWSSDYYFGGGQS